MQKAFCLVIRLFLRQEIIESGIFEIVIRCGNGKLKGNETSQGIEYIWVKTMASFLDQTEWEGSWRCDSTFKQSLLRET